MTTNRLTDCLVIYASQSALREIDWTAIILAGIAVIGLVVWRFNRGNK